MVHPAWAAVVVAQLTGDIGEHLNQESRLNGGIRDHKQEVDALSEQKSITLLIPIIQTNNL